jgi:FAD/FMN-containing dehydrogenase
MTIQPNSISIPQLRPDLNGRVIGPHDAGYDEARSVFHGGFDRRPAVIVRAADATDVSHVVSLARETGLELAVRSGGHSLAGHSVSHGGIVLDLSMRALEVDVERRTAWAQTGLTAAEYTAAAGAHGLATGFGDSGSVGIGGITLGGGVGFLVRKHGLTIDDLLAAEVVTAEGRLLRVDAETHPDLFWAIRGGGGNFGVATRFQFRLHEVDMIVGGMLILPATPDVIHSFVVEAEAAPEELSTIANVMPAPPAPFVPTEHHGRLVVVAILVHAGSIEAGDRAVPGARRADHRHAPADAISGDLPAGRGGLPPGRGGAIDVRRRHRPARSGDDRRPPPGLDRVDGGGADPGSRWSDGARARRGHGVRAPQESDHGERRRGLRAPRGGGGA